MRVFHHPQGDRQGAERLADVVMWTLIAAVALVNLALMWRIATGGV